jgi:hypothetical protein
MPAFSGEPWHGAARVKREQALNAENSTEAWVATEQVIQPTGDLATWEGNAGTSLTLWFRWRHVGAGGGGQAPNFATVEMRTPDGAIIGSAWSLSGGSFPAQNTWVSRTFHFDTDPLNQTLGTLRSGLFEIYLDFGSSGGLGPWHIDTRGVEDILDNPFWARGALRGRQVLGSFTISNVALAGAEPASFAYPDSLFLQAIQTSSSIETRTITASLRRPAGVGGASERSQGAGPSAATTQSYSWTGTTGSPTSRVGEGIAALSEGKDIYLVLTSSQWNGDERNVWADSGHPAGWEKVDDLTLRYVGRVTVDPRVTLKAGDGSNGFHFQKGLPTAFESSAHDASYQMQVYDLGHATAQVVNARGEARNGLGYTITSTSAINGAVTSTSGTTAASDGLDGMTALVEICPNGKPGGNYNLLLDITSPSDIDDPAYIVNPTGVILTLADDPSLNLRVEAGDPSTPDMHWVIGRPMVVGMAPTRRTKANGVIELFRKAVDSGTGKFSVGSFNYALGRLETLASDGVTWEYVEKPHLFSTAVSPGDAWLNLFTFAAETTAQWGANRGGYFVQGGAEIGGVYKAGGGKVDSLGIAGLVKNDHGKWHPLREAIG